MVPAMSKLDRLCFSPPDSRLMFVPVRLSPLSLSDVSN
jgi:hypothetical protein